MAAGINDTFRQVSIAVGVAAWGAIFLAQGADKISTVAAGTPAATGDHPRQLIEAASGGQLQAALQVGAARRPRDRRQRDPRRVPERPQHDSRDRRRARFRRRAAGPVAGPRARDRARAARADRSGEQWPRRSAELPMPAGSVSIRMDVRIRIPHRSRSSTASSVTGSRRRCAPSIAWRLRRLGWETRADATRRTASWATGDPPPRDGCSLDVLVDGAEAFPAIAEAIEHARDYVYVTGWHVAPYFELVRGRATGGARRAAGRGRRTGRRAGCWCGPARRCPRSTPPVRRCATASRTLTRGTRIRCEIDPREHPFHCHHEKTVVVDGEVAFVGGIDMTDYAGDRFDTSDHPARRRLGWHDVGTRLRGPAVARRRTTISRCGGAS